MLRHRYANSYATEEVSKGEEFIPNLFMRVKPPMRTGKTSVPGLTGFRFLLISLGAIQLGYIRSVRFEPLRKLATLRNGEWYSGLEKQ